MKHIFNKIYKNKQFYLPIGNKYLLGSQQRTILAHFR